MRGLFVKDFARNFLSRIARSGDFNHKEASNIRRGRGLVLDFESRRAERIIAREHYSVTKQKLFSPNEYGGITVPDIR